MSTSDVESAAQRPKIQCKDDYDIEINIYDQEEYFPPPPPQQEETETSHTPELQFVVQSIIREAQPPVKQKRHQFGNAPCEEENSSKDATKLPVTSIVLAHIQSFRARSSERSKPIEEPNIPELTPAEANPENVVTIPVTQFSIFVQHAHRGFSAVLPYVHQPIAANNRPVLRFVHVFPRFTPESTPGSSHDIAKLFAENFLAVSYIG
uniref:Uncharacterized protein n=1 Tax=Caenorhabditis japonica TaxID=281687 RepID=A0A8R1J0P6_CAEJA